MNLKTASIRALVVWDKHVTWSNKFTPLEYPVRRRIWRFCDQEALSQISFEKSVFFVLIERIQAPKNHHLSSTNLMAAEEYLKELIACQFQASLARKKMQSFAKATTVTSGSGCGIGA